MAWKILIVDDSLLTRKRIRRIIEMAEFDVEEFLEAENGAEALKILEGSNVNLVLSDLNMPEMSGAEMIRQMKTSEATKSIPVVVISTESKTSRIKELLADGVKDYLHKPFTPEEFKQIIQTIGTKSEIDTDDCLTQALAEAFETMAFLTALPVDDEMIIPQKTILAEIGFSGAKRGTIQMLAGLDFCETLAENIAAIEVVDNQAALDALQELSNVTCGLLLPMIVSSTADEFEVAVPKVENCDNPSQWDEFVAEENSCILNMEGHAIAARLIVENNAMAAQTN